VNFARRKPKSEPSDAEIRRRKLHRKLKFRRFRKHAVGGGIVAGGAGLVGMNAGAKYGIHKLNTSVQAAHNELGRSTTTHKDHELAKSVRHMRATHSELRGARLHAIHSDGTLNRRLKHIKTPAGGDKSFYKTSAKIAVRDLYAGGKNAAHIVFNKDVDTEGHSKKPHVTIAHHQDADPRVIRHELGHAVDYLKQKQSGKKVDSYSLGSKNKPFETLLKPVRKQGKYRSEVRAWDYAGVHRNDPVRKATLNTYAQSGKLHRRVAGGALAGAAIGAAAYGGYHGIKALQKRRALAQAALKRKTRRVKKESITRAELIDLLVEKYTEE